MIIHSSKKLAAKLPNIFSEPQENISPLSSWHARLYHLDRRQCVLFCHDQTRYTVLMLGLVKAQFAELGNLFRDLWFEVLQTQGVPEQKLKQLSLMLGPIELDTNTDRSVQASMRIAKQDLEAMLYRVPNVLSLDPIQTSIDLSHATAPRQFMVSGFGRMKRC